jgi:hypothetical protein
MDSRVRELRLRLRCDADDPAAARQAGEKAVRAVLERCADLLEASAPGRIHVLRRLPLRWSLEDAALDDPGSVEDLARATADAISRAARPQHLERLEAPGPAEAALVFDGEAHVFAAHLLAGARGHADWFAPALRPEEAAEPLAALVAPARRDVARAVLLDLARADALAEVLSAQPPAVVAMLGAALGLSAGSLSAPSFDLAPARSGSDAADPAASERLAATAARWPPLCGAARALALRVHAALLLDANLDSPSAGQLVALTDDSGARAARPVPAEATDPARPGRPPAAAPNGEDARESDGGTDLAAFASWRRTRCAGMFFLLALAQEIDLMQAMWRACLPEGAALAAAWAALLGPDFADDPAPTLCGGGDALPARLQADEEQIREVAVEVCAALAEALPRRGLAELPAVVLSLVEIDGGRLLIAAAEASPFVLFATPADSPPEVEAGVRLFRACWPPSGVIFAPPGLASVDRAGRLWPRADLAQPPPHLPACASPPVAALLAMAAGAPCQLFVARAGARNAASAADFVTRFLARPGRLRRGAERIDVILAADAVDFAVRRAGLDRDPGWLPWLGGELRFTFEAQAPVSTPD